MTSSDVTIQRLRVESFRGFRDPRDFDLSATSVIVTGPNGTGKTSFFDAIQWCLVGSIDRLEDLRARRNVEHIVNQYRIGRKAFVEIVLMVDSVPLSLRRTGDHNGSTLELRRPDSEPVFGRDAEDTLRELLLPDTDLPLAAALTTSGLMQQDVMRRVLEAKPTERYRHISTVLGLGELEEFEEAARSLARAAQERERTARAERDRAVEALHAAQERLVVTQVRLDSRPEIEALRDEVRSLIQDLPTSASRLTLNADLEGQDAVRALATQFGQTIDAVEAADSLSRRAQSLRPQLSEEPGESVLTALQATLDVAEARLASSISQIASARTELSAARAAAADLAQLAALAIPLLTDACPVCGQKIDPSHVEAELRGRADSTETIVELQNALALREAEQDAAQQQVTASRSALSAAQLEMRQWEQYRSSVAEAEAALRRLRDNESVISVEIRTLDEFTQTSGALLEYLRTGRRRLLEFLNAVENQSDRGAMERAGAEITNLRSTLAAREATLDEESTRSRRLQALAEHSVTARVEVTERRVRAMQPLVANIYQRLDPHPAFKTVEFELNTYYRRGTTSPVVKDLVENVVADPLVIFSTSQANIVALSYFIAMSLSAGRRGLPFLLLDDPVQSMDDVNVLGFADLCRHLQERRQLIVSTHERRFAGLLERKLAPRTEHSSTRLIRFEGWNRSGPAVEQRSVAAQLLDDPIRVVHMVS